MADASIVLVHGGWHGAWCWEKVTPLLKAAGVQTHTLDLPLTSLTDDAAAVSALLDDVGGPVLLVGHSYGGAVITEAGMHPNVERLVYMSAFALSEGESPATTALDEAIVATDLADALEVDDNGMMSLRADHVRAGFYADCSDEDAASAQARLRPMALTTVMDAASVAAWRSKPSTYIVCANDAAVHPDVQRFMAKRCGADVVEMPTSHSPFFSDPAGLAAVLIPLAR